MKDNVFITEKSAEYELLDSGEGRKLERYGEVILSRPDPQALWQTSLPDSEWKNVSAVFETKSGRGKWHIVKDIQKDWQISLSENNFNLQLLSSKHLGVFPEQSENWKWLTEKIKKENRKLSVLNLFGYTGGATLACARAGADVCHVDASEFAVDLAMKNRDVSGLSDKLIRFIVEDVRKFVEREIKRGNTYDIILLDPPVYGKGVKKEVWKIEEDLVPLLSRLQKLLSINPVAVVLNGYASGYSHLTYAQMLESITKNFGGAVSSGELAIRESSSGRLLPSGIVARWEKNQ
ncbi:MAG: class I SAM-dependent methyltransferase [bacterium]